MINWLDFVIAGFLIAIYALFMLKIWPVLKENMVISRALDIVYQMEEELGAGTGAIKFDLAVKLLQEWIDKRHWNIDVDHIRRIITAVVGELHAQQGKIPVKPETPAESEG